LLLSTTSVTLTLRFPTKWKFRTTQPRVNFASNCVIGQDLSDARCKQSRGGREGKRRGNSESDTGVVCRVRAEAALGVRGA